MLNCLKFDGSTDINGLSTPTFSERGFCAAMLEAYKRAINPLRRYLLFIPVSSLTKAIEH